MSWVPSASLTAEWGGSESLDSFSGESGQQGAAGGVFWNLGAALLGNEKGGGYVFNAGAGTPGVSLMGLFPTTSLLTTNKSVPEKAPSLRAQTDRAGRW